MNELAAKTTNEQVARELSSAQCQMNDTADGDGDGDLSDLKVVGPRPGYGANLVDADTAAIKPPEDPQLIAIRTLDEDTCPGKERPLVDGAPDAAQNSDRVLWESTKSVAAPLRRSPLTVLAAVVVLAVIRRC